MLRSLTFAALMVAAIGISSCSEDSLSDVAVSKTFSCDVELVVLGIGQDAAAPQIGYHEDPAWNAPALELLATSLAVVDHRNDARYLFEATPNIARQLKLLDDFVPSEKPSLGLSAIFLTHAHIGHYAGLMFLGREAAGAKNLPVFAMPRMKDFLQTNGPWEQLVALNNIQLNAMQNLQAVTFEGGLTVTPFQAPHRDEYSETVGYVMDGGEKKVLFIPDIDSWDEWETDFDLKIEEMIASVDYAFIDATFYSDNELPGRDMSQIPHPRVLSMMDRFDSLSAAEKAKINFIHINHTNPIRFVGSQESQDVAMRGYNVARRGDKHCLKTAVKPLATNVN